MDPVTITAVAVAVSVDSFLVGLSYGAKGLRMSTLPVLGIGLMSGLVMALALLAGEMLSSWLGVEMGSVLGGLILIGAAARIGLTPTREREGETEGSGPGMLSLLTNPALADRDHSGHISPAESLSLGLALSIDSFGVGVGVSTGAPPSIWLPLAAGLVTILALAAGLRWGRASRKWVGSGIMRLLPAVILFALGLERLLSVL